MSRVSSSLISRQSTRIQNPFRENLGPFQSGRDYNITWTPQNGTTSMDLYEKTGSSYDVKDFSLTDIGELDVTSFCNIRFLRSLQSGENYYFELLTNEYPRVRKISNAFRIDVRDQVTNTDDTKDSSINNSINTIGLTPQQKSLVGIFCGLVALAVILGIAIFCCVKRTRRRIEKKADANIAAQMMQHPYAPPARPELHGQETMPATTPFANIQFAQQPPQYTQYPQYLQHPQYAQTHELGANQWQTSQNQQMSPYTATVGQTSVGNTSTRYEMMGDRDWQRVDADPNMAVSPATTEIRNEERDVNNQKSTTSQVHSEGRVQN